MLPKRLPSFRSMDDMFEDMQREMLSVFNDLTERSPFFAVGLDYPLMNVDADEDEVRVRAQVPGMNPDDIELSATSNTLTLKGKRQIGDFKDAQCHKQECMEGHFVKSLGLPYEVDADNVKANQRDGILYIKLPRASSAKPKKVLVSST